MAVPPALANSEGAAADAAMREAAEHICHTYNAFGDRSGRHDAIHLIILLWQSGKIIENDAGSRSTYGSHLATDVLIRQQMIAITSKRALNSI
jgi:hypothetical protein